MIRRELIGIEKTREMSVEFLQPTKPRRHNEKPLK